jgi:hypothetical protein
MTRLNEELVKTRAQEIRENLNRVRRYASQSDDEFRADERNLYTVMHLLHMSHEATPAMCNHILARASLPAPRFEETAAGFRVTLLGHGDAVLDHPVDGRRWSLLDLNERQD